MTVLRNSLLLLILMAAIVSCGPSSKEDATKSRQQKMLYSLLTKDSLIKQKPLSWLIIYVDYTDNYPEDSMAVEYLFKGAEFCLNLGEGQRAIDIIRQGNSGIS